MAVPAVLAIFVATLLAMEGFAYAMHRWVMHGPGWVLHASHHRPRTGRFEANDLYAFIFALPSILLLYGGVNLGWGDWAIGVGAGIAGYGAVYFGFHDVIVHKRIAHRYVARSLYMKRIVQAHLLHHAVASKAGAVSFGFLWAPPAAELAAELARRGQRGVRAPGGRSDSSATGLHHPSPSGEETGVGDVSTRHFSPTTPTPTPPLKGRG